MDKCWCGQDAEYGCHGIIAGEIRSYGACPSHKYWGSMDDMPESVEQSLEGHMFEQLLLGVPNEA